MGKVTKFQGHGLFRFGVLSNLLAWRWNPPQYKNRVKGLEPEKTTGHDNVTSKELILADEAVKPVGIKSIIRNSITNKKFPSDYKVDGMKTIFKKGEKTDNGSYMPISILSLVNKFLEGQVCKIIDAHLKDNEKLKENHGGFRKTKLKEGLLLNLTENWKQTLDE